MKKPLLLLIAVAAMAFAGTATAALVPGVLRHRQQRLPGRHLRRRRAALEKNCHTETVASAGADITGLERQTFTTATFTLASAAQCHGRITPLRHRHHRDRHVLPRLHQRDADDERGRDADLRCSTPLSLAAGGIRSVPTGTITSAEVLIDVEGTAGVSKIAVNV